MGEPGTFVNQINLFDCAILSTMHEFVRKGTILQGTIGCIVID